MSYFVPQIDNYTQFYDPFDTIDLKAQPTKDMEMSKENIDMDANGDCKNESQLYQIIIWDLGFRNKDDWKNKGAPKVVYDEIARRVGHKLSLREQALVRANAYHILDGFKKPGCPGPANWRVRMEARVSHVEDEFLPYRSSPLPEKQETVPDIMDQLENAGNFWNEGDFLQQY